VDEADIIKTDGKYIYVADEGTVHIIAADKGELYAETDIDVIPEEATASVCEIYVDGDTLCVIAEVTTSGFAEQSVDESTVGNGIITLDGQNDTDDTNGTDIYDVTEDMAISSTGEAGDTATYTVTSKTETRLLTYDIGDIKNPALSGSIAQDGLYYDSRKIGDKVFIFTSEYMNRPSMTREEAAKSENAGRWLPLVNGEAIACGDIYVPDEGDFGLVISSVDIGAPSDVIDTTLIISGYTEIYVSESAIYLYDIDYTNENIATAVAKFAMNDGVTDAVAAATVPGEVTDTFAISENNGILRVLTSDMSDTVWTNGLYLYDENMKLTGKLEDLALGEEIYAARYIGDVAYFVTYRNTDPLFAVDISDPSKPTVLSELKITGFSEYLHPWGTDAEGRKLLLGIGYETDPDTGNFKGMKLTMFDITDPSELNVIDTYVIKGAAYSPALYNYKAVLADPDKNLIGFAVTSSEDRYMAFSWEDGSFHRQLDVTLEQTPVTDGASIYESRSLYIGDYLYVASRSGLISYDMTDDFAKVIEYSTGSD
jgi:uncharacterized secreted protein with C-terminal beta-propeller domain